MEKNRRERTTYDDLLLIRTEPVVGENIMRCRPWDDDDDSAGEFALNR